MKITGRLLTDFCVELDKLDNVKVKECQQQKNKVLNLAKIIGLVVGKNGKAIEIHSPVINQEYSEKTLLANMFVNNDSIIVNSDHLWNIAEGMLIQENGDY